MTSFAEVGFPVMQINLNIWTHLLLHLFVPAMNRCAAVSEVSGRGIKCLLY